MDDGSYPSDSASTDEVVFDLSGTRYPFVRISEEESCRFELKSLLPRGEGTYAEYFHLSDADPERVTERLDSRGSVGSRVLSRGRDGGLLEIEVSSDCPVLDLSRLGAIPTTVSSDAGDGRIVAQIPPGQDVSRIVDEFLTEHEDARLSAKRGDVDLTPFLSADEYQEAVADRLTDRQREVLERAYESGYYERPRDTTGEKLAADLGITLSTFTQHVRTAERKLLSTLYDDGAE